jgi:hypothetical protein
MFCRPVNKAATHLLYLLCPYFVANHMIESKKPKCWALKDATTCILYFMHLICDCNTKWYCVLLLILYVIKGYLSSFEMFHVQFNVVCCFIMYRCQNNVEGFSIFSLPL